jgi:hypothetical protein
MWLDAHFNSQGNNWVASAKRIEDYPIESGMASAFATFFIRNCDVIRRKFNLHKC